MFDIKEPVPDIIGARAFAMLSPWVDVGKVGSLTLSSIESASGAKRLGKLSRPGDFYDFTRYRPTVYLKGGVRKVKIPNTILNYTPGEGDNALVFFHCMEPHAHGETYIEAILEVLRFFEVTQYCLIGGMYDSVPHTRPLMITGSSSKKDRDRELRRKKIRGSGYQGPTSITSLLTEKAGDFGIETITMLVHLPSYAQMEEDYMGVYTALKAFNSMFGLSVDLAEVKQLGEEQYKKLDLAVENSSQAKEMVKALEENYDAEVSVAKRSKSPKILSPEIENFLRDMSERFHST
ncbi:MAG: PAC2 family protein [Dehalococcoidia bacterium]|nr:PAC2 family protein [Dehalococcoidia bacterium]